MSYHFPAIEIAESYDQYLQHIADLDVTLKENYELLYVVNAILSNFVDMAFNVQTDQITLGKIHKNRIVESTDPARIGSSPENRFSHAQRIGVDVDSNPAG